MLRLFIMPPSKRIHRKTFRLTDQELRQFAVAQAVSSLNESEFMRQRCLDIVKRRRIPLSQIQIYQQLALLQQQTEQILAKLSQQQQQQGQQPEPLPTEGRGRGGEGNSSSRGDGYSSSSGSSRGDGNGGSGEAEADAHSQQSQQPSPSPQRLENADGTDAQPELERLLCVHLDSIRALRRQAAGLSADEPEPQTDAQGQEP